MSSLRIGFIGAGQMAQALARGFVRSQQCSAGEILAYDPVPAAADAFSTAIPGVRCAADNRAVVLESQVIWLAVKPQQMSAALASIQGVASPDKLFVSVAAGVPLARLVSALGTGRVVRVMPNTPCLVGFGAAAFATGP